MILVVLPEADKEAELASLFYESLAPQLGFHFTIELEKAYRRILSNPKAWTPLASGRHTFRRCLINRFPYGLIYAVRDDRIIVVTIMHLSRKPGYWKKRRLK